KGLVDGTFQDARTLAFQQPVRAMLGGDFDRDGHDDVFLFFKSDSGTERPVRFMFGEGAGYFRLGEDFTGDNTWFGQFNPRVDNWPDLVTTDSAAGTIQFWFGTAQGSFDPGPTLSVGPAPTRVLTTDLDGDGDEDLAFRNGRGYGDEATLVFSK